jgi:hypothetical protein
MPSFGFTYEFADFEIASQGSLGNGFPATDVNLKLNSYTPAAIMVSSFVLYWCILVPIVFPATKPKGESAVRFRTNLRGYHNFFLFLYSGVCCFSTCYWLYADGQLFDWHELLCKPVAGTWLRPLSVTFTISKIVEWIDTAFLIWIGSKKPQFLHTYHHATTFWLFCIIMNLPGPEKFGLLLNGGVHTMMYSHYWRPWPKSLVPLITILQIIQLATVTYVWTVSPNECPDAAFATAPKDFPLEFMTPYAMVPVFLYFFVVFFLKRFVVTPNRKTKKA